MVLNLTGHKDEVLCRGPAENVCCRLVKVTVCTGGFHVDGITEGQLLEVQETLKKLENQLMEELEKTELSVPRI